MNLRSLEMNSCVWKNKKSNCWCWLRPSSVQHRGGVPATPALNAVGSEQHWQELTDQEEHTPAHGKFWLTIGGPTFCGSKNTVLVYQEGTTEKTWKEWSRLWPSWYQKVTPVSVELFPATGGRARALKFSGDRRTERKPSSERRRTKACPHSKDSDSALALFQVCKGWPCRSCRAALLGRVPPSQLLPPTAHPLPMPWRGYSGSHTPPSRNGTCTCTGQKLGCDPLDTKILLRACYNGRDLPAVLTSSV